MPAGWVSAAVGAVGVGENIAANSSANSTNNANNAQVAKNNAASNTMLSEAESVSQQPYVPYTGAYGAPLSGNQQQAVTEASQNAYNQTGQNLVEQGVNQTNAEANNTFTPSNIAKYENPYTSSVVGNEIENANQSYDQSLGTMKEQQAQEGAFGGSGTATGEAELAGQNQLNIGNLTATGYSNAYNAAVQAWGEDNQRMASAAGAYQSAGQDITQMNADDIQSLLATGGAAQAVAQTNLTGEYNEFLRQQGWSANQLAPLINAVKGTSTQQLSPGYQSNTANSLLGLGSTLAGLYGSGLNGSSNGVPSGGLTSSQESTMNAGLNANTETSIGGAENDLDLGDLGAAA